MIIESESLAAIARVSRWGHYGTPVLLFPSAGGDFEEVERFHLVRALAPLIDAGRIMVFSVDGVAARVWLRLPVQFTLRGQKNRTVPLG